MSKRRSKKKLATDGEWRKATFGVWFPATQKCPWKPDATGPLEVLTIGER